MLLVFLYPTSLSLLNSELICRSYGSSGFLESGFVRVPAVVPWYPAVVPLRGHKRQYRSAAVVPAVTPQQYYRWLTRSLPRRFEGSFSVSDCAVPRCSSSAAVPPFLCGSTMVPSGSTAEESEAAVPLCSGSTGGDSAAVLLLAYQVPTASI